MELLKKGHINQLIRILLVEDSEDDAELIERALEGGGLKINCHRVESLDAFASAMNTKEWDAVCCDYRLEEFTGLDVLELYKSYKHDIPFIIVSGEVGEEIAIRALKAGAHNYVMKDNTTRLASTLIREIKAAGERKIRRQVEENLRDYHAKFRAVVESAMDAIISFDENGNITSWNMAAEKIFGYKYNEVTKKSLDFIIPERYQAGHQVGLKEVLSRGNEKMTGGVIELTGIRKSGEEFPLELSLAKWSANNRVFFTGIIREITARKEMIEKLKESERKYRGLFAGTKDLVFFTTPEGKIKEINQAGLDLLGFSSLEDAQKIVIHKDLYVNEEDRKVLQNILKEKGFVKDYEVKIKKRDLSILTVLITAHVELSEDGNIEEYRGIIKDVTTQRHEQEILVKTNADLMAMNTKLKQAQSSLIHHEKMAALGNLAAGIAHEINNPLGFVSSNIKTLKKYMNKIEEYLKFIDKAVSLDSHSALGEIKSKIDNKKKEIEPIIDDISEIFTESEDGFQRISTIVENMRRFSRVDDEGKKSLLNLNDAIKNTLVISKHTYKYVAEIKTDFSEIPEILCNGSEINQVILNLIVNAAQAIEQQERETLGLIQIKTFTTGGFVTCQITDNGSGIPKKILNHIFDPFFTTKDVGGGTGLGLSISYDIIVNKHLGELSVNSEVGKGTTFLFKLPPGRQVGGK